MADPITDKKHKPKFGSLSLLTAGKQDKNYDARLAKFNWQSFYAKDAGAAAVETLREQLVSKADIILIDSRTGLTDAGGICSIQIPDGVVLMTAPKNGVTAVLRLTVVPSPSCPLMLRPQQRTAPVEVTTQPCIEPTASELAPVTPLTTVGTYAAVVVPFPSCP